MNADLVFSADLLTNAKIVEEARVWTTPTLAAISERWDNMISMTRSIMKVQKRFTPAPASLMQQITARTEDQASHLCRVYRTRRCKNHARTALMR